MNRTQGILSVLGLLSCLAAPAAATDFTATCRYFSGLAFNDQHTRADATFRTELADDCLEAFAILSDPGEDAAAKAQAAAYLLTLQRYREALFDMARARYEQAVVAPRRSTGRSVVQPVTRSGEILIARVMGLTEHRRNWTVWREARAQ